MPVETISQTKIGGVLHPPMTPRQTPEEAFQESLPDIQRALRRNGGQVAPPELKRRSLPVSEFKVLDADEGIVEAIVNVFGVEDFAKERTVYGCCANSLAKRKPYGVWMHNWDIPVARTLEAEELSPGDERLPESIRDFGGMYIKAQFNLETQRGREAFSDLKFGLVDQFSIGYYVIRSKMARDGVLELLEIEWVEWSPVLVGCNPMTALLSAKGLTMDEGMAEQATQVSVEAATAQGETKGAYLGSYVEADATMDVIYSLFWSFLYGPVWDALYTMKDDTVEERAAHLEGGFNEYRDISLRLLRAMLDNDDEEMQEEQKARLLSLFPKPSSGSAPAAVAFEKQVATALAAVEDCVARAEAVKAMRAETGRSLSEARRSQMDALKERLERLTAEPARAPEPPGGEEGATRAESARALYYATLSEFESFRMTTIA